MMGDMFPEKFCPHSTGDVRCETGNVAGTEIKRFDAVVFLTDCVDLVVCTVVGRYDVIRRVVKEDC